MEEIVTGRVCAAHTHTVCYCAHIDTSLPKAYTLTQLWKRLYWPIRPVLPARDTSIHQCGELGRLSQPVVPRDV
jgi:hypothetical protein